MAENNYLTLLRPFRAGWRAENIIEHELTEQ